MARWAAVGTLILMPLAARAQAPAPPTILGEVQSVDPASRSISVRLDDGSTVVATLAEKAAIMKVAPGEKSLQNAAAIEFAVLAPGDRVLVRGGEKAEGRIEGALRVVVMAKTDLAARNEAEQQAWRERAVVGTVTAVDPAKGEFTIQVSSTASAAGAPAPAPQSPAPVASLVIAVGDATLHRYSDTSARFDDAKPARIEDMAVGDQLRLLGSKVGDGSRMNAEHVVFGSFKTRALSVESVDVDAEVLHVKDLESNQKFSVSLVKGGTLRRIPAEMGNMLTMMANGGGRGAFSRPPGSNAEGGGAAAPRAPGGEAPQMGGPPGRGRQGGGGPGGPMQGRGGGARGGRGFEGIVERMPTITLADLKKDDWIGAVVGKIDPSGHAIAFNMLAGIEIFASRASRGGGVEVGMPAGLLDSGIDVP